MVDTITNLLQQAAEASFCFAFHRYDEKMGFKLSTLGTRVKLPTISANLDNLNLILDEIIYATFDTACHSE